MQVPESMAAAPAIVGKTIAKKLAKSLFRANWFMLDIAIVVVAFNRPVSLERLLRSLAMAIYPQRVNLIISIDKGGPEAVLNVANSFQWGFGEKLVHQNSANLGLRKHILQCGNLLEEYEHLIVLEDDLFVSPDFFMFALQAAEFYSGDERIAGISLYKHAWNYLCNRPFDPVVDGSDVFFLQHAMSWGQVWSREKWRDFMRWYAVNSSEVPATDDFPGLIASWPKSSWLKYHNRYVYESKKYFVYPHSSLCTNFSDSGTHAEESTDYQVALSQRVGCDFRFAKIEDTCGRYDIYFESLSLAEMGPHGADITIDLYGQKSVFERYALSSRKLPYKVLNRYGLKLRPHELNIRYSVPGNFFYLYDTAQASSVDVTRSEGNAISYDVRSLSRRKALSYALGQYRKAAATRMARIAERLAVFFGG